MRPLALIPLLVLLVGCSDPLRGVEAGQAVFAANDAALAGDASRAVAILRKAAVKGDLDAHASLSAAYQRGYLQVAEASSHSVLHVPIWTWPWDGPRWRRTYRAEVDRRAALGEPDALRARASQLLTFTFRDGTWYPPTAADSAAARAILLDLASGGDTSAMLLLGFHAHTADPDESAAWLTSAREAGDEQACRLKLFLLDRVHRATSPARLAAAIDHFEACGDEIAITNQHDFAGSVITSLRSAATGGNADAARKLDSLAVLGVFERHSRLVDA